MKQHFTGVSNMPRNNNQKVPSAAARVSKLPLVRSACTTLSVWYMDTKCSHPNLRSMCEALESSVTAVLSPVIGRLEPQISIANDIACTSLDWLETVFPVLHTPTEQILATAKSKIHEIQDVVSAAAGGTKDCVEHTAVWLMGTMHQVDEQAGQSLVERAVSLASVGLDSALLTSEALIDQVLPPTEEDKEAEAPLVEGFEVVAVRRRFPVGLASLCAKLYRRAYHMIESKMQSVQFMENLSRSSGLLQTSWMDLTWNIQALPQYLQHQLVSVLFFISQMYNLSFPPPQNQSSQDRSRLNAAETSVHKGIIQVHPQAKPPTCRLRQSTMKPGFDNGRNVEACVC